MTEEQIPKLSAVLVEHQKCFNELSTADAQWMIQNPQKAIALFCKAIAEREETLLELVGTVDIAQTGKFIASDKFVVNTGDKATLKIAYVSDQFKEWFLDKTEEPADGSQLARYKLVEPSTILDMVGALGDKANTTLAQVFYLMEQQGRGEEGVLLVDGYANIFIVPDINGVLRAVFVHLSSDGWDVYALLVEDPFRWRIGDQVFSSNS